MKKALKSMLALSMGALLLSGCAGQNQGAASSAASSGEKEQVELTVFAAASLTETMEEIAKAYQQVAPEVTLVFNFDSSGTLRDQIAEGAVCDLFLSAGQSQMDDLDAAVSTKNLDFVLADSRCDLLENKVVLIVPAGTDSDIMSFEDAGTDKVSMMAVGGADVPVGQYTEEIYTNLGLWDTLNAENKLTFGSNVKEVLSQVAEAAVDCGVVYATDAATEPDVQVVAQAPADSHQPVVYPAAIINTTAHEEQARAFLTYLQGDECKKVFESVGFTVL